jgi:acetyl/propionyl-CoA carboxylase alpha subunit
VTYRDGDAVWIVDRDVGPVRFALAADADAALSGEASLEAPMPGTVVQLRVEPGAAVAAGETLVVLESMKMEIQVQSPRDGAVAVVLVAVGDLVERGATLIELVDEGVPVLGSPVGDRGQGGSRESVTDGGTGR